MTYFRGINYSLGNEDTTLEHEIVKEEQSQSVLSICGSGSRFIPFLTETPREIIAIDLSQEQLYLAELKLATTKEFDYNSFLKFWGYPPFHEDTYFEGRKKLFESLSLSSGAHKYFKEYFESLHWNSILYEGKWEKTFKTLFRINNWIVGRRAQALFKCKTLDEQKAYLKKDFPKWKWNLIVRLLGNKQVFDALLYKGHFIKKNVPESYYRYYQMSFKNLFNKTLVRESFFMNLCFFGKLIFKEANYPEVQEKNFKKIQENLQKQTTKLSLLKLDLLNVVTHLKDQKVDFCSLSDVPSYFTGDLEHNYLQLLKPILKANALVVIRYYLRIAEANVDGFTEVTSDFHKEIENEKVQMYRTKIYRFQGN